MQPVVLDTDVASLTHRRRLPAPLAARLMGRRPIITFVTLGELTTWMQVRQWGSRSRQAVTWGRLSGAAHLRGRPRSMNDMWIEAVCLTHDLPLATMNVKDHVDFVEYHGLRLITAE